MHADGTFAHTTWAAGTDDNRFRVNSPDAATGPFKHIRESQADGVMRLSPEVDPATATAAGLYLELWGGHPGVKNKRVTVNNGPTLDLPEVGAAEGHCTYSYPTIPLPADCLKPGENEFAFTCDGGGTFWGHYLISGAALVLTLPAGHPKTVADAANCAVSADVDGETVRLKLDAPGGLKIARVDFQGHYDGFDDDGDNRTSGWHGYTKNGEPIGFLGDSFDASMLPTPRNLKVRAIVHLGDGLSFTTQSVAVDVPSPATIEQIGVVGGPRSVWSRENVVRPLDFPLNHDPADVERAELHVKIWDGGRGDAEHPVRLNGVPLAVAGEGWHDVIYRTIEIDPATLRRGDNRFEVQADTEHHGIEVLRPGPNLFVRLKD